jgi:hypothetical protein
MADYSKIRDFNRRTRSCCEDLGSLRLCMFPSNVRQQRHRERLGILPYHRYVTVHVSRYPILCSASTSTSLSITTTIISSTQAPLPLLSAVFYAYSTVLHFRRIRPLALFAALSRLAYLRRLSLLLNYASNNYRSEYHSLTIWCCKTTLTHLSHTTILLPSDVLLDLLTHGRGSPCV